ncbi:MAG: hypothetical protein L6V93_08680 [Clostridiales bacterium]|nr:MAG: hypothetical protein L6V93_08680 [Clostridiales bacterium]
MKDGALLATNADDIIVNYASKEEFKEKIARAIVLREEKEAKTRIAPDILYPSDEKTIRFPRKIGFLSTAKIPKLKICPMPKRFFRL